MIHEILPVGHVSATARFSATNSSREAIVVDPGDNIREILEISRGTDSRSRPL